MGPRGLLDLRAPPVSDTRGGRAPLALLAPPVHPPSQVPTDKVSTLPLYPFLHPLHPLLHPPHPSL